MKTLDDDDDDDLDGETPAPSVNIASPQNRKCFVSFFLFKFYTSFISWGTQHYHGSGK